MCLLAALALLFAPSEPAITRDSYGVPIIQAPTLAEGFRLAGQAIAEDRLWQLEVSRRLAKGQMSEIMGSSTLNSDRDILLSGYSESQLLGFVKQLPRDLRIAFESYAEGINETLKKRTQSGDLPPGYAKYDFSPRPWSVTDSAAIMVRMGRLFGSGGGGELRNRLLYLYLEGRQSGEKVLDVLDDFAWFNDPHSPTTVSDDEDPLSKSHPAFLAPSRAETLRHLKQLPASNLFELGPAVRIANAETPNRVAQSVSAPFKTGSYAIVACGARSSGGVPTLLSAPQMGHTVPSVIHEMSISCPGYVAAGMDVPGIPGILIGKTPYIAWGLTSGVADTSDIFYLPKVGDQHTTILGKTKPLVTTNLTIQVKGGNPVEVVRRETDFGPVLLDSRVGNVYYVKRDTYRNLEVSGLISIFDLARAKNGRQALNAAKKATLSFNIFFACTNGDIGWRFCGRVPERAPGWDNRFPLPASAEANWKGMIPADKMPYVLNPPSGLISNWNNKPVSWWPNFDTPVWGSLFRVNSLRSQLTAGRFQPDDFVRAAMAISRLEDETQAQFLPDFVAALKDDGTPAAQLLKSFDGWKVRGSVPARIYLTMIQELRKGLFVPHTGNFLSDSTLNTVAQASVLRRALDGQTKFDYLAGRTKNQVIEQAFASTVSRLTKELGADPAGWGYSEIGFAAPDGSRVPYANRGSYIQIVELLKSPTGKNVLAPGVAEAGTHSADQVELARSWTFKPMP